MSWRRPFTTAAALVVAASCGGGSGGLTSSPAATTGATTTTAPPAVATAPPTAIGAPDTVASTGRGVVVTPSGVVVPVLAGGRGRWRVRTPCGVERTISAGKPVGGTTIVVDPGHGGSERGAISPGGLAEAAVNLAVAARVVTDLQGQGIAAVLTRTGDYDVSLTTRALIATDLGPRALVSVHHNSQPDGPHAGPGTETYYQIASADSKRLAGLVYEEVVKALAVYEVPWVGDTDAGAKYRPGSRGDYYAILRQPAPLTSALAELAFMSNPPEAALLARPDVQAVEGDAVARGVIRWLRTADPGSGFTTPYPRVEPPAPPGPPPPPCVDPKL